MLLGKKKKESKMELVLEEKEKEIEHLAETLKITEEHRIKIEKEKRSTDSNLFAAQDRIRYFESALRVAQDNLNAVLNPVGQISKTVTISDISDNGKRALGKAMPLGYEVTVRVLLEPSEMDALIQMPNASARVTFAPEMK